MALLGASLILLIVFIYFKSVESQNSNKGLSMHQAGAVEVEMHLIDCAEVEMNWKERTERSRARLKFSPERSKGKSKIKPSLSFKELATNFQTDRLQCESSGGRVW